MTPPMMSHRTTARDLLHMALAVCILASALLAPHCEAVTMPVTSNRVPIYYPNDPVLVQLRETIPNVTFTNVLARSLTILPPVNSSSIEGFHLTFQVEGNLQHFYWNASAYRTSIHIVGGTLEELHFSPNVFNQSKMMLDLTTQLSSGSHLWSFQARFVEASQFVLSQVRATGVHFQAPTTLKRVVYTNSSILIQDSTLQQMEVSNALFADMSKIVVHNCLITQTTSAQPTLNFNGTQLNRVSLLHITDTAVSRSSIITIPAGYPTSPLLLLPSSVQEQSKVIVNRSIFNSSASSSSTDAIVRTPAYGFILEDSSHLVIENSAFASDVASAAASGGVVFSHDRMVGSFVSLRNLSIQIDRRSYESPAELTAVGLVASPDVSSSSIDEYLSIETYPSFGTAQGGFAEGALDAFGNLWMIPFYGYYTPLVRLNVDSGEMTSYNNWPATLRPFSGGVMFHDYLILTPFNYESTMGMVKVSMSNVSMSPFYIHWPVSPTLQADSFMKKAVRINDTHFCFLPQLSRTPVVSVDSRTGETFSVDLNPSTTEPFSTSKLFKDAAVDANGNLWLAPFNYDAVVMVKGGTGEVHYFNFTEKGIFPKPTFSAVVPVGKDNAVWLFPYNPSLDVWRFSFSGGGFDFANFSSAPLKLWDTAYLPSSAVQAGDRIYLYSDNGQEMVSFSANVKTPELFEESVVREKPWPAHVAAAMQTAPFPRFTRLVATPPPSPRPATTTTDPPSFWMVPRDLFPWPMKATIRERKFERMSVSLEDVDVLFQNHHPMTQPNIVEGTWKGVVFDAQEVSNSALRLQKVRISMTSTAGPLLDPILTFKGIVVGNSTSCVLTSTALNIEESHVELKPSKISGEQAGSSVGVEVAAKLKRGTQIALDKVTLLAHGGKTGEGLSVLSPLFYNSSLSISNACNFSIANAMEGTILKTFPRDAWQQHSHLVVSNSFFSASAHFPAGLYIPSVANASHVWISNVSVILLPADVHSFARCLTLYDGNLIANSSSVTVEWITCDIQKGRGIVLNAQYGILKVSIGSSLYFRSAKLKASNETRGFQVLQGGQVEVSNASQIIVSEMDIQFNGSTHLQRLNFLQFNVVRCSEGSSFVVKHIHYEASAVQMPPTAIMIGAFRFLDSALQISDCFLSTTVTNPSSYFTGTVRIELREAVNSTLRITDTHLTAVQRCTECHEGRPGQYLTGLEVNGAPSPSGLGGGIVNFRLVAQNIRFDADVSIAPSATTTVMRNNVPVSLVRLNLLRQWLFAPEALPTMHLLLATTASFVSNQSNYVTLVSVLLPNRTGSDPLATPPSLLSPLQPETFQPSVNVTAIDAILAPAAPLATAGGGGAQPTETINVAVVRLQVLDPGTAVGGGGGSGNDTHSSLPIATHIRNVSCTAPHVGRFYGVAGDGAFSQLLMAFTSLTIVKELPSAADPSPGGATGSSQQQQIFNITNVTFAPSQNPPPSTSSSFRTTIRLHCVMLNASTEVKNAALDLQSETPLQQLTQWPSSHILYHECPKPPTPSGTPTMALTKTASKALSTTILANDDEAGHPSVTSTFAHEPAGQKGDIPTTSTVSQQPAKEEEDEDALPPTTQTPILHFNMSTEEPSDDDNATFAPTLAPVFERPNSKGMYLVHAEITFTLTVEALVRQFPAIKKVIAGVLNISSDGIALEAAYAGSAMGRMAIGSALKSDSVQGLLSRETENQNSELVSKYGAKAARVINIDCTNACFEAGTTTTRLNDAGTACECVCKGQYTGARCEVCPTRYSGDGCNQCAGELTGYPACAECAAPVRALSPPVLQFSPTCLATTETRAAIAAALDGCDAAYCDCLGGIQRDAEAQEGKRASADDKCHLLFTPSACSKTLCEGVKRACQKESYSTALRSSTMSIESCGHELQLIPYHFENERLWCHYNLCSNDSAVGECNAEMLYSSCGEDGGQTFSAAGSTSIVISAVAVALMSITALLL